MSVDGQFLALQRSDIEVQLLHRASRASYWVQCRPKAGNRLLHGGVLWNTHSLKPASSQDLFLVTRLGLEHHRASAKRRRVALHRSVGLYVHEFWYAASHGVLLLSTGSRANEIVPFLLHGASVEKLPKLVFSTAVGKQDLRLVCLYGDVYAVYSDSRSTKLLLYLVGRTKVTCVRSLNLMLPPGTALEYSVVDNLLVCHSLDFNVSLFFDIKCDGNINDPFSAPLPISARPPGQPPPESKQISGTAASFKVAEDIDIMLRGFDSDVLKVIGDESDPERCENPMWDSSHRTLGIRRALSVDDLDVHSYIDDASLPSPSFKSSPAAHLANRRSARRLQRAMSATSLEKPSIIEDVVQSFTRWRFHAPNFVQMSFTVNGREQVEIRKLQVNLTEIYKTCEHHPEILPFLLRRGDYELAKSLVLRLVRSHILEQQASLSSVVQLLNTVQTVYGSERRNKVPLFCRYVILDYLTSSELVLQNADGEEESDDAASRDPTKPVADMPGRIKASPPGRNARGFLLIHQSEFYREVWNAILQNPGVRCNFWCEVLLTILTFCNDISVCLGPAGCKEL
ncbi:unnamed protein product [Phytophthora fragariaefolia]|uniref:Unnamed protein product n=1 Tax=Phytophthora fragariaefolia TaxID=1490495 RepID=A0A9W6UDS0_9STRA|nr:unnamed protein product [Phytophthora fragariaefolia]